MSALAEVSSSPSPRMLAILWGGWDDVEEVCR